MTNAKAPASDNHDGMDQDQFLTILSREDALARFEAALFPRPVLSERRPLAEALGCALSEDVVAPIDVPPFDRSNVDGFAVRSADLASAAEAAPVRLRLNDEVIACGTAPTRPWPKLRPPGHRLRSTAPGRKASVSKLISKNKSLTIRP